MKRRPYLPIAAAAVFFVIFNLGYVFHDVALGDWLHEQEGPVAREEFNVALIGLAFCVYSLVLAYLFPMFRRHHEGRPLIPVGVAFGVLMGVVFDALQGGIIEHATMNIPFIVFAVDSSYHVFVEGSIAGLLLALSYRFCGLERRGGARAPAATG